MLVQASRDGNLEVVLRLLYTNPFINRQELRDALWEAVRCKRLEVLRSLLEFRVDPTSAPSPALSKPPAQLSKAPWTPLVALAVNGSVERAEIVAELLSVGCCMDGAGGKLQPLTQVAAAGRGGIGAALQPMRHKHAAQAAPGVSPSSARSLPSSAPTEPEGAVPRTRSKSAGAALEEEAESSSSSLLGSLLVGTGPAEREGRLARLRNEELATVEGELEALLRMVRGQRQKRLEQQLQSVQRRHAEVSRNRQELEEEQACVVCSELEKTVLFMPCRHLCTCEACASQLVVCPICRAQISEKVRCIRP